MNKNFSKSRKPLFDYRPILQGLAISAVAMASLSVFAWVLTHDYHQRTVASEPASYPAEEPDGDTPVTETAEAPSQVQTDSLSQGTPDHGKLWGNCPKGETRVLINGKWICAPIGTPSEEKKP